MKCDIAKDLITLYVEGMCSTESEKALEEHLKECTSCAKQLEQLKKELGNEAVVSKKDYTAENEADLKPMKKVKKKLRRRKAVVIVLGLVLVAMLTGIVFLSYGQMTNRGMSFSALADAAKLKKVCESVAEGDTQALLDVTAFRIEDVYQVKWDKSLDESFEIYKEGIKKTMDEAYAYHFEGKDIDVKIEEIWLTPYDELTADNMMATTIYIGFYEGKERIYAMYFSKASPKKFIVAEMWETEEEPEHTFTANLLPYESVILEIGLRHATTRKYDKLLEGGSPSFYGNGIALIVKTEGTEEERAAFSENLREKLENFYTNKWYFKDVLFAPEEFSVEKNRWIYKVWFEIEDQESGSIAILEQRFTYFNNNLYPIEEEEPVILATSGQIPADIEKQLLTLFR